jgi:hypothetical protein
MPINEITAVVPAGEQMTVTGPGVLEFKIPKIAATTVPAAGAGKGAAVAGTTKLAAGTGAIGGGVGQSTVVTGGASAKSVTASLMSGKVLGFSLGAVNPWLLLGIGAMGGYYYFKKKSLFPF